MADASHPRIGLACAGGAVEGAIYEIGALCALEEAIDGLDMTRLDAYVGVSAGALVTALLANGVGPRTLSRALLSQADPLLNMRPDILFTPAVMEYARRVGKLPKAVLDAVLLHLKNPLDLSLFGALAGLRQVVPVGLFDNEPIARHLADAFAVEGRTDDFRELDAMLRIVAVNLDSSEVTVFGDADTAHVPISKAVQASTALPVLYCPVEIDGEYYIDGVARRTLHASRALEAGTELLFCINPIVPVDVRSGQTDYLEHSLVELGLPAVLLQTFRTVIHSRMKTGFKKYQYAYPDADLLLIEPDLTDYDVFFSNIFSFSKRQEVCERAYAATRSYLRGHAPAIRAKLHRHGLRLRTDVLWESRTLFGHASPLVPADLGGDGLAADAFTQPSAPHDEGESADLGAALDRLDAVLERLEAEVTPRVPQQTRG